MTMTTAAHRVSPVAREAVLSAERLSCTIAGRTVVDTVDLALGRGEILGLLGPNGAGKTTLIRALAGLVRPSSGRVVLDRQNITALPVHRRSRLGLGYLPQEASVFTGLTATQNIEAVLQLRRPRMPRDERRRAALALLDAFELASIAGQRASTLSGGERRRLELARLLATAPRVILLDEPLAGLDPLAIEGLQRQIARLRQEGVSVLLADHNVQQALTICCRACILVDGCVIAAGSPDEVIANETAQRAFFGPTRAHGLGASHGA